MKRAVSAVVLAGGKGSRMRRSGVLTSKALLRVDGAVSLLEVAISRAQAVAAEVIVAVGLDRKGLTSAIPDDQSIRVVDDAAHGTGMALLTSVLHAKYDTLLVVNADTLNDFSFRALIDHHAASGLPNHIALTRWHEAQNPHTYAVGADGRVLRSYEDGKRDRSPQKSALWYGASTGALVLGRRELADVVNLRIGTIERDLTPRLISAQRVWAFDVGSAVSYDAGTPERIQRVRTVPKNAVWRRD